MTILMPVYLRASYHRHRVNRIGKPLPRYHDGRDAHNGHLRAYSRQGAHLYFVGSLTPFNLTRRTRRAEQGVPYLCGFPTYDWRRVCQISLINRRRYPTRRMVRRRVCREHRRVST
jgi:hypothetical protein